MLQYQWKVAHRYTYQNQDKDVTLDNVLDVLERNGDDYLILARMPSRAPNHALLFLMDGYGLVKWRKYLGSTNVYDAILGEEEQLRRLNGPLGLIDCFRAEVWEMPPEGLIKNKTSSYHGRNYLLKDFVSSNNLALVCVETIGFTETREPMSNRIDRIFDVKNGCLHQYSQSVESATFVTELASVVLLKADVIEKSLKDCKDALDEDAFRLQVCLPYLTSTNKWSKRSAYFCLMNQVLYPKLLPQVYSELSKAAGPVWQFSTLADCYLFKHIEKGEEWAIRAIQAEDWSQLDEMRLDTRISKMQRFSGLEFAKDQDNWKLWLGTVSARLPRLLESSTQELREAAEKNVHPWVRLFSIRELCKRGDADVKAILEKAKADDMKEIRDFAADRLKALIPTQPADSPASDTK